MLQRSLENGGFSDFPAAEFCPWASSWAALALPEGHPKGQAARAALAKSMRPDGGIPVSKDQPGAIWPTYAALMALPPPPAGHEAARAAAFLLSASSEHWRTDPGEPVDHDTNLRGWSWTAGAYGWVEPTGMAMLALSAAGHAEHPRVLEGRELLIDRMMPWGGWNYGNISLFGARLEPDVVNTSVALAALAGRAVPGVVAKGLDFLSREARALRAPLSLAWALLALGAWARPQQEGADNLARIIFEDHGAGPLPTATLALALIALQSPDGLAAHLERRVKAHAA